MREVYTAAQVRTRSGWCSSAFRRARSCVAPRSVSRSSPGGCSRPSGRADGVTLLVGAGDNGGDALWAGAQLRRRGFGVTAVLLDPRAPTPAGWPPFVRAGGRVVEVGPDAQVPMPSPRSRGRTSCSTASSACPVAGRCAPRPPSSSEARSTPTRRCWRSTRPAASTPTPAPSTGRRSPPSRPSRSARSSRCTCSPRTAADRCSWSTSASAGAARPARGRSRRRRRGRAMAGARTRPTTSTRRALRASPPDRRPTRARPCSRPAPRCSPPAAWCG